VFTPSLNWDITLWEAYDWLSTICFPKPQYHEFVAGTNGLGFFGLINANTNGFESKWYGEITL